MSANAPWHMRLCTPPSVPLHPAHPTLSSAPRTPIHNVPLALQLNFRNQIKRWEAEQEVTKREKQREQAQAEFEAEQQYLDTLAHLPSRDADKYRQMQGVRRA